MRLRERGSGTVYAAIATVMLTASALAVMTFTAAAAAHHRAASAADLAALAAAQSLQRGGDSCADAARIATRNGARLTGCRIDGEDVIVEVSVDGPTAFGRRWTLGAAARAGPAARAPPR
jgi:secretion/DNA translocation related TadE-like protein